MRWAALFFWCLLLATLGDAADPARAEAGGLPPADRPAPPSWPGEIKGIGMTRQKAEADAVQHALEELLAALREEDLGPWRPDADFIRKYVLQGDGRPGPDEEYTDGAKTWTVKTWVYALKPLPLETVRYFRQKELLSERGAERQTWALAILGGAALACLVALGILRFGALFPSLARFSRHNPISRA